MRTIAACINCVMHDLIGAAEGLGCDEEQRFRIVKRALGETLSDLSPEPPPSFWITAVHRILKEELNLPMPYKELREASNAVGRAILAEEVLPGLAGITDELGRLRFVALWSVAANGADFRTIGTGYELSTIERTLRDDLGGRFGQSFDSGLQVDDTNQLLSALKQAKQVAFIHDNVCEIAVDKALISEMRRHCDRVISIIRGGPITSDAVAQDAIDVRLDEAAFEIVSTETDTLGIQLADLAPSCRAVLDASDVIVTKGQANWYEMDSQKNNLPAKSIFCLLRTKCVPVSSALGWEVKEINAVARVKGES